MSTNTPAPIHNGSAKHFVLAAAGWICLALASFSSSHAEEYRFERMWPALQQPWYFFGRFGLAVDRDDNVYVADEGLHRVSKWTPSGRLITAWGGASALPQPGLFWCPLGVAINSLGEVLVASYTSIQAFTPDGHFLRMILECADDVNPGRILSVAVNSQDEVFALEPSLNSSLKSQWPILTQIP